VLDTVTTLNSTSGVTGDQKAWTLNAVGDWNSVTTDGTATNSQNEITAVGATSMTSDNNGNEETNRDKQAIQRGRESLNCKHSRPL
jgi:hypothetical protein